MFTCPYCLSKSVPAPVKGSRYQTCKSCGLRPRVKITKTVDGKLLVKYVKTNHGKGDLAKRKSIQYRVTESELQDFYAGKCYLTFYNNRIQLQYKQ